MKITFKVYSAPVNADFYVKFSIPYSVHNLLAVQQIMNVANIRVK